MPPTLPPNAGQEIRPLSYFAKGATMKPEDCCADCRAIVDGPTIDHEPHGASRGGARLGL